MEETNPINNLLFHKLIENSIFTQRQIQIIYKYKNKNKRMHDISSGAYYRQLKQSKLKLKKICYSIMLLDLMNVMGSKQITALHPIVSQLRTLNEGHENYHKNTVNNIVTVIDQMVDRVLKM